MKCDNIRTRTQGDTPFFPNMLNNANVEVCLKEDVDEAIAELKQKLESVQTSMYCGAVILRMMQFVQDEKEARQWD